VLQERQKSILGAAIEDYIRTARPVASSELARDSGWGLSPATIRAELLRLDELGYLEQPHTSAGRIPTDKGYRFFVDNLTVAAGLDSEEEDLLQRAFAIRDAEEFIREFTKTVARVAGAFAAAGIEDAELFYESGFSEILGEPEFSEPESAKSFGRIADLLDERMPEAAADLDEDRERIWIGAENPWKEARQCAMILAYWEHPAGFRGFLNIIGPRRTNYSKHKAIIRRIRSAA
jgi:heat-inducible transcriptional repressor